MPRPERNPGFNSCTACSPWDPVAVRLGYTFSFTPEAAVVRKESYFIADMYTLASYCFC